jgi:hypothetical protein
MAPSVAIGLEGQPADNRRLCPHTGVMGVGCSVTGWSAVASASANASLAAVLAGFMINGIVLVLGFKPSEMKAEYIQALALLFAAFVALGLDAFLFGLVTGDGTNIVGKVSACRRTWTEAMLAAGLLGIGAVVIVASFVILFTFYIPSSSKFGYGAPDFLGEAVRMLERLCNALRGGVAVVVVALLYMTSRSYLIAVFNGHIPLFGTLYLYIYFGAGLLAVGIVFGDALIEHSFDNRVSRFLRVNYKRQFIKALEIALYFFGGYTIISGLAAAVVAGSPARFWNPTSLGVQWVIFSIVIWVSIVSLIPILLLLARAVPDFGQQPLEVEVRSIPL